MIRHGESGRNPSFFRDSAQFFGQREKKIHKIKKRKKLKKTLAIQGNIVYTYNCCDIDSNEA